MLKEHLRERGVWYALGYVIFLVWVGVGAFLEADSVGGFLAIMGLFAAIGAVAGAVGLALYLLIMGRIGSGTPDG